MKSIGIFPASGALGTSTFTRLLRLVPHDKVTLISRFPDKIPSSYKQSGVTLRQASYEATTEELERSFAGIDTLFLISYPSHQHQLRTRFQIPAMDAAVRAGVKHIFYSSLGFALPDRNTSKAEVMGAHLDSEAHLKHLAETTPGFTWTSIREGLYSESFPIYTAFADVKQPTAEINIPHDGSGAGISWVKRDELGEATARLIADYAASPGAFPYVGKIVALTGPKEYSLRETVEILARVTGNDLKIKEVSVEEYANQAEVLDKFGSVELATTWATAWEAIRDGETAAVVPLLGEILGREPEGYEVTLRDLLKG